MVVENKSATSKVPGTAETSRSAFSMFRAFTRKNKARRRRRDKSIVLKYSQNRLKKPQFGYDCEVAKELLHRTRNLRYTSKFPGNMAHVMLQALQPTWTNFLEEYGMCNKNLSLVNRPMCFNGLGFMAPPHARNESRRSYHVRRFLENDFWLEPKQVHKMAKIVMKAYNVSSFTVSLINRAHQIVKLSINHGMTRVPRNVSLDGHAVLSKGDFTVLDTETDWRFAFNPLTYGPPFIHFYSSVPLVMDGVNIGVVAVYDSNKRTVMPSGLVGKLTEISKYIQRNLITTLDEMLELEKTRAPQLMITERFPKVDSKLTKRIRDNYTPGTGPSLKSLNFSDPVIKTNEMVAKLMSCKTTREAMTEACRLVVERAKLDFAYLVEIRINSTYDVPKLDMARYPRGVLCREVKNCKKILGKKLRGSVHIRILGGYGIDVNSLELDETVHRAALDSIYGVAFSSENLKNGCKAGVYVPFQKTEPRLVFDPTALFTMPPDEPFELRDGTVTTLRKYDANYYLRRTLYKGARFSHLMSVTENNVLLPQDLIPTKKRQHALVNDKPAGEDANSMNVNVEMFSQLSLNDVGTPESQVSDGTNNSENGTAVKSVSLGSDHGGIGSSESSVLSDVQMDHGERDEDYEDEDDETSSLHKRSFLKVSKRYGGFMLGGFSKEPRSFSVEDLEYLKACVSAIDRVFGFYQGGAMLETYHNEDGPIV